MTQIALTPTAVKALATNNLHDRLVGCLFGSALGDAVGLYTEFLSESLSVSAYPTRSFTLSPPAAATPFRRDAHRNPHHPGEWTDDTDHAMLLLLSYLHKDGKELSPIDFAVRLEIWVRQGLRALDTLPLGLGRTVGTIVGSKTYLQDPEGAARSFWTKCSYRAAPNGSLMRTHPLGLMCLDKTLEETFQIAADFSVVTHVDPRCIISCAIGTALVRGLFLNEVTSEKHIDEVCDKALSWYQTLRETQLADPQRKDEPDLDVDEFWQHAKVDDLRSLKLDESYKIGYVYKTFGSGIHLLRMAMRRIEASPTPLYEKCSVFEPLITDLIMLGGDADTNACFAGALLGTYLGYSALPQNWTAGLLRRDWLMSKSEGLACLLGVSNGAYKGSKDRDTAPDGGRGILTDKQLDEMGQKLRFRMEKEEAEWKAKQAAKAKSKSGIFSWT